MAAVWSSSIGEFVPRPWRHRKCMAGGLLGGKGGLVLLVIFWKDGLVEGGWFFTDGWGLIMSVDDVWGNEGRLKKCLRG